MLNITDSAMKNAGRNSASTLSGPNLHANWSRAMADASYDEEWRPVYGWEGVYEVSSHGRVKRVLASRGTAIGPLKATENMHGYLRVGLCRNRKSTTIAIHKLVCEAFHGPKPFAKAEICHGDGDKRNNSKENLRWDTRSENMRDRYRHGQSIAGENSPAARLSNEDVAAIRSISPRYGDSFEIASRYGISRNYLSKLRNGSGWEGVGNAG